MVPSHVFTLTDCCVCNLECKPNNMQCGSCSLKFSETFHAYIARFLLGVPDVLLGPGEGGVGGDGSVSGAGDPVLQEWTPHRGDLRGQGFLCEEVFQSLLHVCTLALTQGHLDRNRHRDRFIDNKTYIPAMSHN